jgi:hypothetical protein
MRRALSAAGALAGTLVLGGGIAAAHKAQIDTTVTLTAPTGSATAFVGTVTAKGGCRKERAVSLFRTDEYSGRTLVGTATTDTEGAFSITPNPASAGSYQATVAFKKVKKGKRKNGKPRHKHKCLEGSSPAIAFDGAGSPPTTPPTPPPDY